MRVFSALVSILMVAGCLGVQPAPDEGSGTNVEPSSDDRRPAPILGGRILEVHRGDETIEADVLCVFAGGPELPRTGAARALPGALRVTVEVQGLYTGIQAGYSVDGGDVNWLPAVSGSRAEFTVPVEGGVAETPDGPLRWRFFQQGNLPAHEQACYTGGGAGAYSILVESIPDG